MVCIHIHGDVSIVYVCMLEIMYEYYLRYEVDTKKVGEIIIIRVLRILKWCRYFLWIEQEKDALMLKSIQERV